MLGRKLFTMAGALLALAAFTQAASAATIVYSTSGEFFTAGGTSLGTSVTSNGNTLSFVGQSTTTRTDDINGTFFGVNFGTLALTGNTPTAALSDFSNLRFVLTIDQDVPTNQNGTIPDAPTRAIVQGGITGTAPNLSGGITVTFGDNNTTIGGVTYVVADPQSRDAGQSAAILGTASLSVIPLPAAAWGGMALFGLVGALKARRSSTPALV